jgi:hypothetical protein
VDFTLFNEGTGRALVTAVHIRIVDYTLLTQCYAQGAGPGAVPVSSNLAIHLPTWPQATELSFAPARFPEQQVPPDSPDRFVFHFTAPQSSSDNYGIYALRLQLQTQEPAGTLDAGQYLVALPGAVWRDGTYLPEDGGILRLITTKAPRALRLQATWCFRRNLAELRRLLANEGQSSPELSALKTPAIASQWTKLESGTRPRREALQLLEKPNPDAQLLAAFAADQTGDPAFAGMIRRRAAESLLVQVNRMPAQHAALQQVDDALRMSLHLNYSVAAAQQLATTERKIAIGQTQA